MKWYVKLVIGIINWSIDRLWDFIDSNNDNKISKEEIEEVIELIRRRLTYLKKRV